MEKVNINKEKLLIYPYNMEIAPVLRHRSLLADYEISCLVAPNGWGFTGKDAGVADCGPEVGITVSADFKKSLGLCETVMIVESHLQFDFDKNIFGKIIMAIKNKKNIICLLKLKDETAEKIAVLCNDEKVYFKYFNISSNISSGEISFERENIQKIDTPIILVNGTAERTNKFEIQLALRENIYKHGYKISQIGSRCYCEMLGFHSFPSFMYRSDISEVNKVLMFNRFLKKLEESEDPDIIIIGVPGGIMPFNREFTNKFGLLSFEISQAVEPDVVISSLLYEDYKFEGFEAYANSIKYKLGYDVDFFNIANMQFDWIIAFETHVMTYISLDSKFIDEKKMNYSNNKIPVLNILNKKDSEHMADKVIEKLSGYGDVQIV